MPKPRTVTHSPTAQKFTGRVGVPQVEEENEVPLVPETRSPIEQDVDLSSGTMMGDSTEAEENPVE